MGDTGGTLAAQAAGAALAAKKVPVYVVSAVPAHLVSVLNLGDPGC